MTRLKMQKWWKSSVRKENSALLWCREPAGFHRACGGVLHGSGACVRSQTDKSKVWYIMNCRLKHGLLFSSGCELRTGGEGRSCSAPRWPTALGCTSAPWLLPLFTVELNKSRWCDRVRLGVGIPVCEFRGPNLLFEMLFIKVGNKTALTSCSDHHEISFQFFFSLLAVKSPFVR